MLDFAPDTERLGCNITVCEAESERDVGKCCGKLQSMLEDVHGKLYLRAAALSVLASVVATWQFKQPLCAVSFRQYIADSVQQLINAVACGQHWREFVGSGALFLVDEVL